MRCPLMRRDRDEAWLYNTHRLQWYKDHAVNGRSSTWLIKRGHHFFMPVLRSFLALCVLGEAFGTLLNFSEKINLQQMFGISYKIAVVYPG